MEISPEHPSSTTVAGSGRVLLGGGGQITESSTKRATTIQWDEETIAEHDKERGTRQKVVFYKEGFLCYLSHLTSFLLSYHLISPRLISPHLTTQHLTIYQKQIDEPPTPYNYERYSGYNSDHSEEQAYVPSISSTEGTFPKALVDDWQSVFHKLRYHEFIQQHRDETSTARISSSMETEALEGADSKLRIANNDDVVAVHSVDTKDAEKFKSVRYRFTE